MILNWRSHWSNESYFDENGKWLGTPGKIFQEFKLNYNTNKSNLRKANTDILPSNTIIIDIKKSESELLAQMKSKTRYNIGLAGRKGIDVRIGSIDDLEVWYKLYLETAKRNKLNAKRYQIFSFGICGQTGKHRFNNTGKTINSLFRGCSFSSNVSSYFKSQSYIFIWSINCFLIETLCRLMRYNGKRYRLRNSFGCTEYDMFGIAPDAEPSHPMFGLYKFKRGFGGEVYHQLGCWDYPLDHEKYSIIQATETK